MEKRIFYFEEELIGIPDFVPAENTGVLNKYIYSLEEQIKNRHVESPILSVKLEEKWIEFNEIDNLFRDILPPYDEVRFESIPEEVVEEGFAYGDESVFILGMAEIRNGKNVVINLELFKGYSNNRTNNEDCSKTNRLAKSIFNLCRNKGLILFDGINPFKIVPKIIRCESLQEIENYLATPWEIN